MNYFVRDDIAHQSARIVNLRCPVCLHSGAFHGYANCADLKWVRIEHQANGGRVGHQSFAGMRQCPNPTCKALVFVAQEQGSEITSYPPEVIDFDATHLPPKILDSLTEAVKCEAAGAYKASALMVRRVLEELCEDKSATGPNLKARIVGLSNVAVIPTDLISAADELRILGNDAAHVQAKDYDVIGKEEASLAIELAKELLKAVYQYTSLLTRLQAMKKPTNP